VGEILYQALEEVRYMVLGSGILWHTQAMPITPIVSIGMERPPDSDYHSLAWLFRTAPYL
jgi:hypothetical protein